MTADLTAVELERMRRVADRACDAADGWADFDNTFGPFAVRALLDRLEAAEARVARVEALAREWSEKAEALAPADDWGDSVEATVQADTFRAMVRMVAETEARGDA